MTAAIDDESARATPSLIAPARTCRAGDLGAEGGEADASGDLSEQSSEEVATTTIPLHTQRGANPVLPFVPGSFDDASVGSDNEPHAPRASWPADSEEDAGTGTTFLPYADVQPTLEPVIMDGMLGYGPFHYRYASGREGDACKLSIANNASYISLYAFAADANGYVAERYADRFPKAKMGKTCVRFRKLADLDEKALVALIKETSKMGLVA